MLKVWFISSPLLHFSFKSFLDPSSRPFIRFKCILYDSRVLLSGFPNLCKLKREWFNFWGEPIFQNVRILWSPFLHFNFKSFLDPNSLEFIRFQCILYDSGVLLPGFSNFYKLKWGNLISGGYQFWRNSELFCPPFCISILKVLWSQILRHLLDFNAFCIVQENFSQGFQLCINERGGI